MSICVLTRVQSHAGVAEVRHRELPAMTQKRATNVTLGTAIAVLHTNIAGNYKHHSGLHSEQGSFTALFSTSIYYLHMARLDTRDITQWCNPRTHRRYTYPIKSMNLIAVKYGNFVQKD